MSEKDLTNNPESSDKDPQRVAILELNMDIVFRMLGLPPDTRITGLRVPDDLNAPMLEVRIEDPSLTPIPYNAVLPKVSAIFRTDMGFLEYR